MGILKMWNEWKNSRYENHLLKMKEENKCPNCYGRGFLVYYANEYFYHADPFDCPSCNGSGQYTNWANSLY